MAPLDSQTQADLEFVTFWAGGQSYCLDIARVREIRRWGPITPIPNAPPGVMGVMNLRGSVIPIYDLAARLGLPPATENPRNVIVVAMNGGETVGLLVESVSKIISVVRDSIQDVPELRLDTSRQSITGLISLDDGMTRVVDLGGVTHRQAAATA
ncbi:MAG: chemotaxis protein CheW [Rhodobacterales bacterium 32-66-7]|nr:MAG: chemotaxis protein CheW [Rhodobacterales bacterium 32-66-7]